MPRPRPSTSNPSLQMSDNQALSPRPKSTANFSSMSQPHSSSIATRGLGDGDDGRLPQQSVPQDLGHQPHQSNHYSSAFARAKAIALLKTSKLRENSAMLSEMAMDKAKVKGANWKAKAKAMHGSDFSVNQLWKPGKGRRDRDHDGGGDSAESSDSTIASWAGGRSVGGVGSTSQKWTYGGRKETESFAASTVVFGVPLKVAVDASRIDNVTCIPRVVIRCIEYLDTKGLNEVGLYRIPGSTTTVGKLRAAFDSGLDIDFEKTYEDPNAVATLLKMFLRDLPEPVLTADLDPVFHGCLSDYDHELSSTDPEYETRIVERLASVANQLPDENYELLAWLTCHLARVDYYSDVNKMNCSNLGLIFCPTLGISSVMFRYFVSHSDEIFPLPRQELSASELPQGVSQSSGAEVADTREDVVDGDHGSRSAGSGIKDADRNKNLPEVKEKSLAESVRLFGDESSLRRHNQSSAVGKFSADVTSNHTFSSTDGASAAETAISAPRTARTIAIPSKENSGIEAEPPPMRTVKSPELAEPKSAPAPLPLSSPRRNPVRNVRSSFSMGDLIALSKSMDTLDTVATEEQGKLAGDVRLGSPAHWRSGLSREESESRSFSLPYPKCAAHERPALQYVVQSPVEAGLEDLIVSPTDRGQSPRTHDQLQLPQRTPPPLPLRDEMGKPAAEVASYSASSFLDSPGTGSVLGLTSSDGRKVRTSEQLFEYFFAEAERRLQEEGTAAEKTADGSATAASASDNRPVTLMD